MDKRKMVMVVLIMGLFIGIVSLYSTYAYEGDNNIIDKESNTDYNLIYSLKDNSNQDVTVNGGSEKYININLNNTYDATIRYGMYYYMINPLVLPDNVTISLADDSVDRLEDVIKPLSSRSISLRIKNDSEYTVRLIVGALIGFENGDLEELITDGEVLIK